MEELMQSPAEAERLERFLAESFPDGVVCRELRLAAEEVRGIKRVFPNAVLEAFSESRYADGKVWYRVRI
ncbi:hypothetical protein GE107_22805 [Cohnella sp. CFH 77786]|uniref:hypothetical protein n=1 Tax=Cohnella sp. CFH 77786 TaxID=2662265 RepID=UPI001C609508|nr:hypothetical protein [Cohnella sp. CFH 77786]MBW5448874.1 hypothetical protein [Cohnella sp. CFH 77786]